MKKSLMALIAGCAFAAATCAPALCANIVGTVLNANGNAVPGATVSATTPNGQNVGSAVTNGQGAYSIDGVTSGLYYIMLTPPAGSNLVGQNAASYVGDTGLTVNWSVAPGRQALASAMPGITNISSGPSSFNAVPLASNSSSIPPGCLKKHIVGPPCGPPP
jgi:Carboxypeptidase regulatory-like domain